jgi:hypothetical protein
MILVEFWIVLKVLGGGLPESNSNFFIMFLKKITAPLPDKLPVQQL